MVGKKALFIAIGVLATIIAIVGVWLPGVPTTMPLLVALWAFGKSSKRMRAKLEKIPLLRQAFVEVHRFEREKSVALPVKIISQSCAWLSVVVVALLTRSVVITSIVAVCALSCTVFMLYIPTQSKRLTVAQSEAATQDQ